MGRGLGIFGGRLFQEQAERLGDGFRSGRLLGLNIGRQASRAAAMVQVIADCQGVIVGSWCPPTLSKLSLFPNICRLLVAVVSPGRGRLAGPDGTAQRPFPPNKKQR